MGDIINYTSEEKMKVQALSLYYQWLLQVFYGFHYKRCWNYWLIKFIQNSKDKLNQYS